MTGAQLGSYRLWRSNYTGWYA